MFGEEEGEGGGDSHLVLQCKIPAYRSDSHIGIGRIRPGRGYIYVADARVCEKGTRRHKGSG